MARRGFPAHRGGASARAGELRGVGRAKSGKPAAVALARGRPTQAKAAAEGPREAHPAWWLRITRTTEPSAGHLAREWGRAARGRPPPSPDRPVRPRRPDHDRRGPCVRASSATSAPRPGDILDDGELALCLRTRSSLRPAGPSPRFVRHRGVKYHAALRERRNPNRDAHRCPASHHWPRVRPLLPVPERPPSWGTSSWDLIAGGKTTGAWKALRREPRSHSHILRFSPPARRPPENSNRGSAARRCAPPSRVAESSGPEA
jgi:hypothetical protein